MIKLKHVWKYIDPATLVSISQTNNRVTKLIEGKQSSIKINDILLETNVFTTVQENIDNIKYCDIELEGEGNNEDIRVI